MKKELRLSLMKGPRAFLWAVFAVICFAAIFTNAYADMMDTSSNGLFFWEALFSGKLLEFYPLAPAATDYPLSVYFAFAIVNLPIYLLKLIFGFTPDAQWWFIAYNKLGLCGFFAASAIAFRAVCERLGFTGEKKEWATFLYASCVIVMYAVPIVGQYDVLAVWFLLLAVSAMFDGKYIKFIAWASLAVTFKYLAVFALIPLVLFFEKKLWKAFVSLLAAAVPTLLLMRRGLIFRWALAEGGLSRGTSLLVGWFSSPDALFGTANISFFILAYAAVCVFAYLKAYDGSALSRRMAIYIAALAYSALFVFTRSHSYWFIMLSPFLALLPLFAPERFSLGAFVNAAASTCEVLCFESFTFVYCTGYRAVASSLVGKLLGLDAGVSYGNSQSVVNSVLTIFKLSDYQPMAEQLLGTLFVLGIIVQLALFYPRADGESELKIERGAMWFRVLCCAAVAALPAVNIALGAR